MNQLFVVADVSGKPRWESAERPYFHCEAGVTILRPPSGAVAFADGQVVRGQFHFVEAGALVRLVERNSVSLIYVGKPATCASCKAKLATPVEEDSTCEKCDEPLNYAWPPEELLDARPGAGAKHLPSGMPPLSSSGRATSTLATGNEECRSGVERYGRELAQHGISVTASTTTGRSSTFTVQCPVYSEGYLLEDEPDGLIDYPTLIAITPLALNGYLKTMLLISVEKPAATLFLGAA